MIDESFITIGAAVEQFKTSRSTLDRRREAARKNDDHNTYKNFILRTKDKENHHQPTKQLISDLNRAGKQPEWLVTTVWLKSQFKERDVAPSHDPSHDEGHPPQVTPVTPHQPTSDVIGMYESRINDLKELLEREREDKLKLLELAQADKQLFAKANENLTQVLALPGITEATRAQQGSTVSPPASSVVDTTPKPEVITPKPRPKSTAKPNTKQGTTTTESKPKKEPAQATADKSPSRFRRFLFGKK